MTKHTSGRAAKVAIASVLALGFVAQAGFAAAQPAGYYQDDQGPPQGPPQGQYAPPPGQYGPPQGQYAPPQGQYAPPPGEDYDYSDQARQQDQRYASAYSDWAARYCVQQRQNNAAGGAVVGGVLGALLGSGIAGRGNHTAGALVGGAVGATAGAAIGANSGTQGSCPPGSVIASGAPAFYYGGYVPVYGPSWYNPWIFVGGRWSYRPYRAWYYRHPAYWGPGRRHRY